MTTIILASASSVRARLLQDAGLSIEVRAARVDEEAIKTSLTSNDVSHRDIADALAEAKARKVSSLEPAALTIGCDQVLSFNGDILSKPSDKSAALAQIRRLSGAKHRLFTAAVVYEGGEPLWRHVAASTLTMREISSDYLEEYIERNWPEIGSSVGGYMIEKEGIRLFSHIEGDHFHILGIPLLELLSWLTTRGTIKG